MEYLIQSFLKIFKGVQLSLSSIRKTRDKVSTRKSSKPCSTPNSKLSKTWTISTRSMKLLKMWIKIKSQNKLNNKRTFPRKIRQPKSSIRLRKWVHCSPERIISAITSIRWIIITVPSNKTRATQLKVHLAPLRCWTRDGWVEIALLTTSCAHRLILWFRHRYNKEETQIQIFRHRCNKDGTQIQIFRPILRQTRSIDSFRSSLMQATRRSRSRAKRTPTALSTNINHGPIISRCQL